MDRVQEQAARLDVPPDTATRAGDAGEMARTTPVESPAGRAGWRSGVWSGRSRWIAGGVALVVLAPLLWYAASRPLVSSGTAPGPTAIQAAKGVGPLVGSEAPNFKLKDPSGKQVELKQFRGKNVLLNFWATWCVPCKEEMPEIEQAYRQYKDSNNFVVLAVSIDDEAGAKKVPDYLKEGGTGVGAYTFPVALDPQQDVTKQYKLLGVPSSYFIDKNGVIRAVQPGAMSRQTLQEKLRTIIPVS